MNPGPVSKPVKEGPAMNRHTESSDSAPVRKPRGPRHSANKSTSYKICPDMLSGPPNEPPPPQLEAWAASVSPPQSTPHLAMQGAAFWARLNDLPSLTILQDDGRRVQLPADVLAAVGGPGAVRWRADARRVMVR